MSEPSKLFAECFIHVCKVLESPIGSDETLIKKLLQQKLKDKKDIAAAVPSFRKLYKRVTDSLERDKIMHLESTQQRTLFVFSFHLMETAMFKVPKLKSKLQDLRKLVTNAWDIETLLLWLKDDSHTSLSIEQDTILVYLESRTEESPQEETELFSLLSENPTLSQIIWQNRFETKTIKEMLFDTYKRNLQVF